MEKILIQQGDLILVEVMEIPKTARRVAVQGNSFILLKGEGSNTHELQSATLPDDVEIYEDDGVLYCKSKNPANLVHAEHGVETTTPDKIIKRRIEREFDYESMEARNTQD